MSYAPTRVECERLRDEYVSDLRADGRGDAADTVLRDWESFVSFYDFPVEHWVHLRTTNPLESVFSAVRLRTDATRRMKRRDSALYLVFKVSLRLSERWRPLNGGRNLMGLLPYGLADRWSEVRGRYLGRVAGERRGGRRRLMS